MKAKRVLISQQLIVGLMQENIAEPLYWVRVAENALPEDARIVRCGFESNNNTMYFVIESDSYENVEEGNVIPIAAPTLLQTVRKGYDPNCTRKHVE